jgi:hypothetical protein
MNWYKRSQLNKEAKWSWSNFVAMFGMTTIAGLLALNQMGMLDLQKAYSQNPQQIIQQAKQVQQQEQPINPYNMTDVPIRQVEEPSQDAVQTPEVSSEPSSPANDGMVSQENQSGDIDLNKIWQIESTSGQDPKMNEPNRSGALGHFQFLKKTWNEMVSMMGKNWDWEDGAIDYDKSRAVADFYLNKRIPQMLKYYKIPDTTKTRIACYSWGVGYLKKAYETYGENWESAAPTETTDYFVKYGVE